MLRPVPCWHCDDMIGVYEPLVVIVGGTRRVTSLAKEPSAGTDLEAAFHLACAESTGIVRPLAPRVAS